MPGIISVGVFCLTYSWLARRWGWLPTMLAGWLMVLCSTTVLSQVTLNAVLGFLAVVTA